MANKLYWIAILCAALAATAIAQQPNQPAKTWALVVGISKYQKLPGGQQLQFADRDAALFAEAIQKRGVSAQNVRVLTGAEATAAAIKSAIGNWLARSASESDTVLIFFSGHGIFEREFGESYLLGYDSDPKDPYGTALSVSELGQAFSRRVRSGRVLVIADAVRRDFFDPESDPDSAKLFEEVFNQLSAARPGVSAMIACGPGEFSREGQRWGGHGAFTRHLVDVLIDGADKNRNLAGSADELFSLLRSRVADDTSNKQNPWRTGTALAQAASRGAEAKGEAGAKVAPPVVTAESKAADAKKPTVSPGQVERKTEVEKPIAPSQPSVNVGDSGKATRPVEKSRVTEKESKPAPVNPSKTESKPVEASDKKSEPAPIAVEVKSREAPAMVATVKKEENTSSLAGGRPATATVAPKPTATPNVSASKPVDRAPTKVSPRRSPAPPGTQTVNATQPSASPPRELARADVAMADIPSAPKPTPGLPGAVVVSSEGAASRPEALSSSVPTAPPEAAPSPLVLQLVVAITSKNLIEPKNTSAWDFYQRLASDPSLSADAVRLKPLLAEALATQGRAIVGGDVRADNISDKVDDFKRAGQMLARARTLAPDNPDVIALEKLSAAEALISLQFYDEAERSLTQLQNARLASVENALGLVYHGKLDAWRAERAFKRAIELDAKWAAPHYNLALVYRGQQNQASLAELEAAAALDPSNVNLLAALGEEYFSRQQWKQATEAFRKALARKPSDDALHTKLGHALYSQGLQDEANREYQKARELRGKQP